MGHAGASKKSPNGSLQETLSQRLSRPISAYDPDAGQDTCRAPAIDPETDRVPAGHLHIPDTGQGTCIFLYKIFINYYTSIYI